MAARLLPSSPAGIAILLAVSFLLAVPGHAFNITTILKDFPEFSKFNHYLSETHIASDINTRETITILALDNSAMEALLAKQLSIQTLRNVLAFHVLVDYFGASKLHSLVGGSILASTIFQSSGSATGTSGFVNITDLGKGKVGFATEDNNGEFSSMFVKSVKEKPFNISVIQISQEVVSPEAEAPVAAPSLNLTDILISEGCEEFSNLLISTGAQKDYDAALEGGLTVFCPSDAAVQSFEPKYKNLTAAGKTALLLFHGLPTYWSMQMLKMGNGKKSTLASVRGTYMVDVQNDGTAVTLNTPVNTAKITMTVKDEEPLVVYKIDKVLKPKELFKAEAAPAPTPSHKGHKGHKGIAAAPEPAAESPVGAADEEATGNKKKKKSAAPKAVTHMLAGFVGLVLSLLL